VIHFPKLPPAITALLLQLAAFALAVLSVRVAGLRLSPLAFALVCGTYAAAFSHFAGLARWWLAIQFAFVPALVLMLSFDIPSGYFLAAFLVLLVVYWSTFRTQVPLYLSSNKVWHELESYLPSPVSGITSDLAALPPSRMASSSIRGAGGEGANDGKPNFRFVDLGSGLGGVLTHLASVRPDGQYTGVESAPLPFLWSWLRIRLGGYRQCTVQWGSLWDSDLSQYDIVFAYLSPVPMERLWHKARAEMRPGSVFISSTFAVPDQSPHETVQVDDLHRSTLLVWRM
jgi:hypothetical protein